MIPFLALVWAEVAGKREKWKRRLERERGRTGSGDFPANGGRFPMNPRVVEGCRCPGESFESNGELGGGRKMAGQSVAARGEERETRGRDSG